SLTQLYELTIEGNDAELRVFRVRGEESIHKPFAFEIECAPAEADGIRVDLDIKALVTKPATLSFPDSDQTRRTISGLVDAIEAEGTGYRIRIVPKLALLADAIDHQVFVDQDAVEVATTVLGEHG